MIILSFETCNCFVQRFTQIKNGLTDISIPATVAATAATQSVETPNSASSDQKARSISDTKATLKHQQNVLKLQQVLERYILISPT